MKRQNDDQIKILLGKRIKQARLRSNLTQEALGDKINKSTVTVNRYENNVFKPPIDVLRKIAKVTNTPIEEFINLSTKHKKLNEYETKKEEISDLIRYLSDNELDLIIQLLVYMVNNKMK